MVRFVRRDAWPVEGAQGDVVCGAPKLIDVADKGELRGDVRIEARERAQPLARFRLVGGPAPDFRHLVAKLRALFEKQPILHQRSAYADSRPERLEPSGMPRRATRRPEADVRRVQR